MALNVIAKNMRSHEIEGLRALFKTFDKDNSGAITVEEMRLGLKTMVREQAANIHPNDYNIHPNDYNIHPNAYNIHPDAYNIHPDAYNIHPDAYNIHMSRLKPTHVEPRYGARA
eukprot:5879526-Pyramimonas_sp.AAC.1